MHFSTTFNSCPTEDKQKVFFAFLRDPSPTKRCSSRPSATLRGKKGVLRVPSRPFADQRCSLVPYLALRGGSKVFFASLRDPSWIKRCSSRRILRDPSRIKGVLWSPIWPFADQRCSSRPFATLRGPSRPFADQRCSLVPYLALRGLTTSRSQNSSGTSTSKLNRTELSTLP